jgi:hypothetical protein
MISTGRDTYMTVWSIAEKDGKISGRVSTSRKNKQNDTYVNSNWNVRFVGNALEKAKTLTEKSRIKVKAGDSTIENVYLAPQGDKPATSYLSVTIFDFEDASENKSDNSGKVTDDDLPF